MFVCLFVIASSISDFSPLSPTPFPSKLESPPAQREFYKLVISEIPASWHKFGVMLNIKLPILTKVEQEHKICEKCFLEVYSIWESETPCPFTWNSVIEVLKDMKEKRLVKEVNKFLGKLPV